MTPEHGTAALGPTSTAGEAVKTGSPDAADSSTPTLTAEARLASWSALARKIDERSLQQILRPFGASTLTEVPAERLSEFDAVLAAAHRTLPENLTPLEWALACAAAGWAVLPVDPKSKETFRDGPGVTKATTDATTIRAWWACYTNAVPALGCKRSGVFAVDLDCKPGKANGAATFAGITQGRPLPGALVATTPSGGRHYIFRAPPGAPVGSPTEHWPGVDIKGGRGEGGGYVLLPYGAGDRLWLQGDPRKDAVPEAPAWLVELLPRRAEPEKGDDEDDIFEAAPHATGAEAKQLADDLERAAFVLQHVFPDADALDYGQWLFRLMELASLGGKGVELAKAWNAKGSKGKYNPSVDDARFGGFNGERQVASLFAAADEKAPGWRSLFRQQRTAELFAATPLAASDGVPSVVLEAPAALKRRRASFLDLQRDPPIAWRVDDLLPEVGQAVLGGEPSCGKTLIATQLSLAAAHGLPFFGRKIKPASTVYWAAEGFAALGARLRAWRATEPKAALVDGHYFDLIDGVPNLTTASGVAEFRAALTAGGRAAPGIVVVDTLAMAAPGLDENDASAMGAVCAALQGVARDFRCLVLALHHVRKSQPGAASGGLNALRGSSALAGAADVVLLAAAEQGGGRALRVVKSRDGEATGPLPYEIRGQLTGAAAADGTPEKAAVVVPITHREAPQVVTPEVEQAADIADIVAAVQRAGIVTSADDLVDLVDLPRARARRAFRLACAQGRLHVGGTTRDRRIRAAEGGAILAAEVDAVSGVDSSPDDSRRTRARASTPTPPAGGGEKGSRAARDIDSRRGANRRELARVARIEPTPAADLGGQP